MLILAVVIVWTFIIKGIALWHAARNKQLGWFITLLIINTLGVLEIIYLLWFQDEESSGAPGAGATQTSTTASPALAKGEETQGER